MQFSVSRPSRAKLIKIYPACRLTKTTKKISSNSRTKDSRFASSIETFYSHHPIHRRRVRCANCLKSIWNVKIYGIRSQNLSKESLKIESESPLKREHAICDNPDRHTEEDWAWEESRFFLRFASDALARNCMESGVFSGLAACLHGQKS